MERKFSVTCGKCRKEFEFTVSLPGEVVPTNFDAQQSLYSSTTGEAEMVESDNGILEKCKKNKPFSHALSMPEPLN